MADTPWDVRNFVGRTLDSFRTSRLWRMLAKHETSRRPSNLSSATSEFKARTDPGPRPESNILSDSTSAGCSQENTEPVARVYSKVERATAVDLPLSGKLAAEEYIHDNALNPPHYTDGPSKIIMTNDGAKDCLALVLTRDMVTKMNEILLGTCKVNRLEDRVDELQREVNRATIFLEQSLAEIKALPASESKSDEEAKIRQEMKETDERLQRALGRKERTEENLHSEKRNLSFSRDEIQEVFHRVLSESQLVEEEATAAREDEESNKTEAASQRSGISRNSNETWISIDELNRKATYEEVEATRQYLQSLQDDFDGRQNFYDNEFRDYQEAVEEGACMLPQSEFDRIHIGNIQRLTTGLIDAEAAYEDGMARARALDIIGNEFEQESDFVDQADDGYRDSHEAEMAAGVDRFFINAWMDATADSEDQEDKPEIGTTDNWDAESIGISDSISMVAEGRRRVKIDRWRETCGL